MTLWTLGLTLFSAVLLAVSAPLLPRAVLPHDEIVGFPETVPDTRVGQLYLKYKPHLYVANGCVPFPAVDAEGNTRYVRSRSTSLPQRTKMPNVERSVAA